MMLAIRLVEVLVKVSWPKTRRMIEEGIGEYANPSSIIKAVEMLLRHIAKAKEADTLARAMQICVDEEKRVVVTGDRNGATTAAFADYVMETLASLA